MTVRELIKQLEDMDEEVKDYKICVVITKSWNMTTLKVESDDLTVPENCDVDRRRFILKGY